MAKNTSILTEILAHVAGSPEPLHPLAQSEIAEVGMRDKSPQGNMILVALAGRGDLCDDVRKVLESCPRAAVKVAWLSRTDHPDGYVEKTVAKEKRVTVLAEAAAHPSAATSLVNALSSVDNVKVAVAVLSRDSVSDEAKVNAVGTLLKNTNLSYQVSRLESDILANNPNLWEAIAGKARSNTAIWRLVNHRDFVVPSSQLERFTKVVIESWQADLPVPQNIKQRGTWGLPTTRYHTAASSLLTHPDWDSSSPADSELAKLAQRLNDYSCRLHEAVEACRIRHFGSPAEQAEARAAQERLKSDVELARVTDSEVEIKRLLASYSSSVSAALRENPHLTLEQIMKDSISSGRAYRSEELIMSRLQHGANIVQVTAALMVEQNLSYSRLPEELTKLLSEDDLVKIGELIPPMIRSGGSSRWLSMGVARMADNPHMLEGVIPEMTVQELHELVTYEYITDSVKKSIAQLLARQLQEGLPDTAAWKTFAALAEQSEGSLVETIRVATLV